MYPEADKRNPTYTLQKSKYSFPELKVAYDMWKLNFGLIETWL
jgi:hypothetical protein